MEIFFYVTEYTMISCPEAAASRRKCLAEVPFTGERDSSRAGVENRRKKKRREEWNEREIDVYREMPHSYFSLNTQTPYR